MKKLLIIAVSLLVLGLVGRWVLMNNATAQDFLLKRVIASGMGGTSTPPEPVNGLRVTVCGSASPLGNDPSRAQACISVQTPEHFLLFDIGARSPARIVQAQLPVEKLNGVFLTHFHSDHIADLPAINFRSWLRGRKSSLQVFGPLGVDSVVNGFNTAYGLDNGYRTAHHGSDLLPPSAGPMTPITIEPGQIAWQDGELTVRSFLVDHAPIDPAVGYRVDYRGRSVVISGDTNATSSLFSAAQNADLLLHDALSRALLDPMIETATSLNVPVMPKIMQDVIDYHADSTSLEEQAQAAGIKQLALYHLVPVPPNALAENIFKRGLRSDTLLVQDLHQFDLPVGSEQIVITAP